MPTVTINEVLGPLALESRLLVAGDTHGNGWWLRTLADLAVKLGCCGVVQLGDFGFWPDQRVLHATGYATLDNRWLDELADIYRTAGVWLRVIDGNHDAHPLVREIHPANDNGVRPIRDGVIDWADRGAVWSWHGILFGALGGAVSIDRSVRVENESWWSTETITDSDVDTLIERAPNGLDVLLAHDAPILPPGITPLADPILRADCADSNQRVAQAVRVTRPKLLLHGHYHRRYRASYLETDIEGIASDIEAHNGGFAVLDLANLQVM
jgi:hypothetical protein